MTVEDVDVDEQPGRASRYEVRGLPTLVLLGDDGREVGRIEGTATMPWRVAAAIEALAKAVART
jgi:thioredoxin-like negative regulator of GroEL